MPKPKETLGFIETERLVQTVERDSEDSRIHKLCGVEKDKCQIGRRVKIE